MNVWWDHRDRISTAKYEVRNQINMPGCTQWSSIVKLSLHVGEREGDRLLGVIARVIDTPSRAWGEKIAWFENSATTINPAPQHVYTWVVRGTVRVKCLAQGQVCIQAKWPIRPEHIPVSLA